MENLEVFDGGDSLVDELHQPPAGHTLWWKGTNRVGAGGKGRSPRILMPLSLAVNILEKADPRKFVQMAGAMVCPLEVPKVWPKVYFCEDEAESH